MGFQAHGIEPDANVISEARDCGAPVRHGYFPDALGPDERFDVIVFNDVLEHMPDLSGTLQSAKQHLNRGGILCLNCPDKRGAFFRVAAILDRMGLHAPYDRLWQRELPSPHVWYFAPFHLAKAAEHAGYEFLQANRLATIRVRGLWKRIRLVRTTGTPTAILTYLFSLAIYPFLALLPADSTVCFFRNPPPAART